MQQADIDITKYIITGFLSFMILIFVLMTVHSHYEIADIHEKCELKKGYVAKIYRHSTSDGEGWAYDINFTNNIGRKLESCQGINSVEHYLGDSIPILYDKRNDNIYIYKNKTKWQLENGLFFLLILSVLSLMLYFFRKMEMVSADSEED